MCEEVHSAALCVRPDEARTAATRMYVDQNKLRRFLGCITSERESWGYNATLSSAEGGGYNVVMWLQAMLWTQMWWVRCGTVQCFQRSVSPE